MDCFAQPVLGLRGAQTRGLAMTGERKEREQEEEMRVVQQTVL
jgi:hypothetical protein